MINQSISLNDNMVVVSPAIKVWTASSTLKMSDFAQTVQAQLPPSELAKLGSKHLTDPKPIKDLVALRTFVDSHLTTYGIRFFGGVLISAALLPEVVKFLEEQADVFNQQVTSFLNSYEEESRKWAAKFPAFEQQILANSPSVDIIKNKFGFTYTVFTINVVDTPEGTANNTAALINQVPDQTVQTALDTLTKLKDQTFNIAVKLSKKCFNTVDKAILKLEHLAFLNPDLESSLLILKNQITDLKSRPDFNDPAYKQEWQLILQDAISDIINVTNQPQPAPAQAVITQPNLPPQTVKISQPEPTPAPEPTPMQELTVKTNQPFVTDDPLPVKPKTQPQPAPEPAPVKSEPLFVTNDPFPVFPDKQPKAQPAPQTLQDALESLFDF